MFGSKKATELVRELWDDAQYLYALNDMNEIMKYEDKRMNKKVNKEIPRCILMILHAATIKAHQASAAF